MSLSGRPTQQENLAFFSQPARILLQSGIDGARPLLFLFLLGIRRAHAGAHGLASACPVPYTVGRFDLPRMNLRHFVALCTLKLADNFLKCCIPCWPQSPIPCGGGISGNGCIRASEHVHRSARLRRCQCPSHAVNSTRRECANASMGRAAPPQACFRAQPPRCCQIGEPGGPVDQRPIGASPCINFRSIAGVWDLCLQCIVKGVGRSELGAARWPAGTNANGAHGISSPCSICASRMVLRFHIGLGSLLV